MQITQDSVAQRNTSSSLDCTKFIPPFESLIVTHDSRKHRDSQTSAKLRIDFVFRIVVLLDIFLIFIVHAKVIAANLQQ